MESESRKSSLITKALLYKGRVAELSIGLTVNKLIVWAFDFFLYPFVIYRFGILKGGIAMTVLSFIACILTIKFYDWSKRDWLGIEAIKGLKEYNGELRAGRILSWVLMRSDPVALMLLSIYFDPFITTAYLRHGANQFNGMNTRDWKVFISSITLGNAYWTLVCYMGITLVEWGWRYLL